MAGDDLTQAIRQKDLAAVCQLVESGANVNALGVGGLTPLMLAAQQPENHKMVVYLVEHGADVRLADGHGLTAVDHVHGPEEPPEHWENGYEAWLHAEEHYTRRYLADLLARTPTHHKPPGTVTPPFS